MYCHRHIGTFQKCCEVSLRVLRDNKDALMSALESFLHDPLCEWNYVKTTRSSVAGSSTTTNTQKAAVGMEFARKVLKNIECKLDGGMGLINQFNVAVQKHGLQNNMVQAIAQVANGIGSAGLSVSRARSVEGQVQELLQQATDMRNLARMWIGWSAYY